MIVLLDSVLLILLVPRSSLFVEGMDFMCIKLDKSINDLIAKPYT